MHMLAKGGVFQLLASVRDEGGATQSSVEEQGRAVYVSRNVNGSYRKFVRRRQLF